MPSRNALRRLGQPTRAPLSKLAAARYVIQCLRREDIPRASELAARLGVSAGHLSRAFHAEYGITISDYLKSLQLQRAERLLRNTALSTTRIAYACGFGTRRTFFRAYRRKRGRTPRPR